jgi:DNA-binding transcriptional MerR regulator
MIREMKMPAAGYLTITEFARLCGVAAKTLRFYGDIGLFRPAFVDPRTRYRFYRHAQLREFAQIQAMKESGASLAEIRAALRTSRSPREQRRFLQGLRDAKLEAIDEARRSLTWIEGALEDLAGQPALHATIAYCGPVRVASVRTDVKCYADIQQHERSLWSSVAARLQGGLRGVLWHRCADGGLLEGEPFVELKSTLDRPATYEVKVLPAVHIARAFSSLDDQEAEDTYVGLGRWVRDRGYRLVGARREIYRGNLLEIQYPLQVK